MVYLKFLDGLKSEQGVARVGNLLAVNTFTPYGLVGRSITAAGSSNASVYGTQLYTFDRGGNVTDVVNASAAGIGIGAYYYTAYGYTNYPGTGAYVASGTTLSDDTGPAHFGYGGQWGGQTESLSYRYTLFSHRWYDPAYGRWLTRDPSGYSGGMNLYAYANGDSVNNIDPSGLDPDDDPLDQMANSGSMGGGIAAAFHGGTKDLMNSAPFQPGSDGRHFVSNAAKMVPVAGQAYAAYTAITGCDPIAGTSESPLERGMDAVSAVGGSLGGEAEVAEGGAAGGRPTALSLGRA